MRYDQCEELLNTPNPTTMEIRGVVADMADAERAERAALFKLRLSLKKLNLKTADLPGLSPTRLREVASAVAKDLTSQGLQVDNTALLETLTQMAQQATQRAAKQNQGA